ncbi:MAG: anthranilate synthase component I family protein, partial [Bacteroidales bacterium]|nr:anthranilate synthase component I family protein [Bacteroidales bacterium]
MMKYLIKTISRKLLADLQTPVGIYLKIRDVYPNSALLESSDYHGGENSFSFIGFKPVADFILEKNRVTERFPDGLKVETEVTPTTNIPDRFQSFIQSFSITEDHNDFGFNGLFGYTAFDAVRYFEDVKIKNTVEDGSEVPDIQYILYKFIIGINHHKNELTIVENIFENEESSMNEVM